jgi:RNA polymerase sigma-70 factor (ECF subfamily)
VIADNALMLKVKAGDLDQLGLLFERYKRPLFSFFYRLSSDKNSSEDLVQNVFLRIIKYRHTFIGKGEFRTWMYHLARNVFADHLKKNQKQGQKDNLDKWEDHLLDNSSIENQHQSEEIQMLNWALQKLSYERREVLILSRYQELKYSEIAEIMQTTESNIKVMVHRALIELRKIYTQIDK